MAIDNQGKQLAIREVNWSKKIEGSCFENIPKMYEAGADVFVVGTSSVFHKDYTFETATQKVLDLLK